MPLDPVKLQQAEAWVQTHCPLAGNTCPCCGGSTLGFGEIFSFVMVPGQGRPTGALPEPAPMVLPYFCADCGYVRLFSPVIMGIVTHVP
jgi:hypothetical protein